MSKIYYVINHFFDWRKDISKKHQHCCDKGDLLVLLRVHHEAARLPCCHPLLSAHTIVSFICTGIHHIGNFF